MEEKGKQMQKNRDDKFQVDNKARTYKLKGLLANLKSLQTFVAVTIRLLLNLIGAPTRETVAKRK